MRPKADTDWEATTSRACIQSEGVYVGQDGGDGLGMGVEATAVGSACIMREGHGQGICWSLTRSALVEGWHRGNRTAKAHGDSGRKFARP